MKKRCLKENFEIYWNISEYYFLSITSIKDYKKVWLLKAKYEEMKSGSRLCHSPLLTTLSLFKKKKIHFSAVQWDQTHSQPHKKKSFSHRRMSPAADGLASLEPWSQHHRVSLGLHEATEDTETAVAGSPKCSQPTCLQNLWVARVSFTAICMKYSFRAKKNSPLHGTVFVLWVNKYL